MNEIENYKHGTEFKKAGGIDMSYSTLEYEVKANVAWIRLNRVEQGNALNLDMGNELMDVAWQCASDKQVRVIVVTGNGKSFSFGGDLKSFASYGNGISKHLKDVTAIFHEAVSRFVHMEKPIIAAVNGTAAGAGMSLAMLADLVVACESAKFTMAYTNVGLTPDGSSSYFLPRIVGARRALELTLTNRVLTAKEASEWGIVTRVVPDVAFYSEVERLANQLVKGPVGAYGKAKQLIYGSFNETLESQMARESQFISEQAESAEGKEGISAFIEKREANYLSD